MSKDVFDKLRELQGSNEHNFKLLGLYESLATFDVDATINLENPEIIPPLLAVANNIITRGNPTIAPICVSKELNAYSSDFSAEDLFAALHLVDSRERTPHISQYGLGSAFEKAYLLEYIPHDKRYLVQFFQRQRIMGTLTKNSGDKRKVDFSFEAPYYRVVEQKDIYLKSREIKQRVATWIVEVDGDRYHKDSYIDDIRDYDTNLWGHDTFRIKEESAQIDTDRFIERILKTEYFKTVQTLLNKSPEEIIRLQTYVLAPVGVARLQKVINQYLIVNYDILLQAGKKKVTIAIIERDVPCGTMAANALNELYKHLVELENKSTFIPEIEVEVFTPAENAKKTSVDFRHKNMNKYDLVIDISVLWRKGIFDTDNDYTFLNNSIIIRSSHFTEYNCRDSIYCANQIVYRDLTTDAGNERHLEIPEAVQSLRYFLENIFFHDEFRPGQLPILNRALKGQSVIGLLPTGGGKSLTYQLAALLQPGITIVIDPLRSLMVDQYEGLLKIGIDKCDFTNSILTTEQKKYVQEKILQAGKTQFLFCSPERMVIEEFRISLALTIANKLFFSYCVVDEAHCVSEWGHDFRTPYLNLGDNVQRYCHTIDTRLEKIDDTETLLNTIPIFGLTATASFDVLADIERELKIAHDDGKSIIRYENTVRDEINYRVIHVNAHAPDKLSKKDVGDAKVAEAKNIIANINNPASHLLKGHDCSVYNRILDKAFKDYHPNTEVGDDSVRERFISDSWNRISLVEKHLPFRKDDNGKYNYGIIVFCPHKTSELGVYHYRDQLMISAPDEKVVYFVGAGRDDDADKESFENLRLFKKQKASVMVATKAFGMGIDKDNVRLTIHSNISSSIESFVQESGRAGRDRKHCLSVILYNNQLARDKEVLDKFYRSSFKGADKERAMLYELRNEIHFPVVTPLLKIQTALSDKMGMPIVLELGKVTVEGNDWTRYLFVKNENGDRIGRFDLVNCTHHFFNDPATGDLFISTIRENILGFDGLDLVKIRTLLQTPIDGKKTQKGIEILLRENGPELELPVVVPFKNKYCSKNEEGHYIVDEYAYQLHFDHVLEHPYIEHLLANKILDIAHLTNIFKKGIKDDLLFEDFVRKLNLPVATEEEMNGQDTLRVRYYEPRNLADTAKAIYRLSSLGIIDTYTIDYSKKVYHLKLKGNTENYFQNFYRIVRRYTTDEVAQVIYNNCISEHIPPHTTPMSVTLKHITNFIYDRIAAKRRRAIDDMVELCEDGIKEPDEEKQSEIIKERIYYYFNAKYTKVNNVAIGKDGKQIPANMESDFGHLSIEETIWKYIEQIIDYDDGGAIINNIKHLRGATMRMLRAKGNGAPQFNILKSYALFILSKDLPHLVEEAITELEMGIMEWSKLLSNDKASIDPTRFVAKFRSNIERHIGKLPDKHFANAEDLFISSALLNWMRTFKTKFLKDYNDAITTSN